MSLWTYVGENIMDLGLADSVCLVTGSSRGIGKGIAEKFLEAGARTVITGRNPNALLETREELAQRFGPEKVLHYEGDLALEATVDNIVSSVIETWGRIDCLAANVGSGSSTPGWNIGPEVWTNALNANLWPAVHVVTRVLQEMINARSGSIVLVSSIAGIEATAAPLAYSAAKSALTLYSKNLSRIVGPHNIRVNSIAPGNILFEGGSWERHLEKRGEEVRLYIDTEVPLKRFGTVEEIANCVAFLSSSCASFVTGACLVADGGQSRSL
jgi:3-oxoacyl-[acyl-carrier protein] reductase